MLDNYNMHLFGFKDGLPVRKVISHECILILFAVILLPIKSPHDVPFDVTLGVWACRLNNKHFDKGLNNQPKPTMPTLQGPTRNLILKLLCDNTCLSNR